MQLQMTSYHNDEVWIMEFNTLHGLAFGALIEFMRAETQTIRSSQGNLSENWSGARGRRRD